MSRRMVQPGHNEWPSQLGELGPVDPPKRLALAGLRLAVPYERTVAIVGTRRPTASGVEAARAMARGLAEADFTIVSGLAVGIDAAAHKAALEVGGYTVAVLGCGLDVPYPKRNLALRDQIEERGTVVSEYPNDQGPTTYTFPRRNRIIAGLAKGVVFIEGGEKSGGRITARIGHEAGRSVFAVPGSLRNPMAAGPNVLIRQDLARLVTCFQDVLEELAPGLLWDVPVDTSAPPRIAALSDEEKSVLCFLEEFPSRPEEVRRGAGLTTGKAALALARLEARGWAIRRSGGFRLTEGGLRTRESLLASTRD